MAGSLLDFDGIAQLAQGNLRNAMQMKQMGLHEQQLGLQERRTAVDEQQLEINRQNEANSRLNSIRQIWQDPRVQHDPELSDQLFGAIAPMVGIPTDGLQDRLTQSHKDRQDLMAATLGSDPQKAQSAVIKLMSGMEPDKAAVFLKNIESVPALHARAQMAQQTMEMNGAKFAELRQNQAIVNEGRGPLTALSSALRDQTKVFSDPSYMKAQKLYKTLGRTSILDPADKTLTAKEKEPLQNLMMGNADRLAENLEPEIMRWQHQLDTANRALIDMDHGVTQPGQMKEQLNARIATAAPILGALRDMQAAYRDPLNSEKAELAKHAYKTIEARRVELESMDKKLDAQRMGLVNLANEKFDYKQSQDNAVALGQQEYFALPDNQRNGHMAAKIAAKVTQDTGVPVKVSDIIKDPNAPASVTNVNMTQEKAESKKVGEKFGDQYSDLQAADIASRAKMAKYDRMDQLLTGMKTGKLTPAMTSVQALADSLGFSVDKSLPGKQAFEALSGEVALSLRNPAGGAGMPGALSDRDLAFLQSMTPDLGKTTEGNKTIIDTARKLAKRDQDVAKMAREYRKKHGQFDEGFFDELATYSEKNQLFKQQSASQPSTKASPSGGEAVMKSLPQGSKQVGTYQGKPVYESSDGKRWVEDK